MVIALGKILPLTFNADSIKHIPLHHVPDFQPLQQTINKYNFKVVL